MNKTLRNILITTIGLGIVGLLVWQVYFGNNQNNPVDSQSNSFFTVSTTKEPTKDTKKYTNSTYGFSLLYPKDLKVTELPADTLGQTILIKNTTNQNNGIQFYIAPFDEPRLTKERIQKDLPTIPISKEHTITIDGSIAGLAFESNNESFGKTYEVWFVKGGKVFQITTYAESKMLLDTIMSTLQFTK